jgi:hypothetical protein
MDFLALFNNKDVLAALLGGLVAFVVPRLKCALSTQQASPAHHRRARLPSFWWLAIVASCLGGVVVNGAKQAMRSGPLSIPLKRQQVPLHSQGGVVQHKSAYYGQISVGAPQSQMFEVVFDTGSGHLVLPSTMCRSQTCLDHRRYKRKSSLLAQDIDVDGTLVQPGQMRDQITVSFGTGEVTGVFVRDRVCLGSQIATEPSSESPEAEKGASLLQVGKLAPRMNATTAVSEIAPDAEGDVAPTISDADTLALAAAAKGQIPKAGPALEAVRAAAKVAYQRKTGDGCVDMRLVATTEMSQDPFSSFEFDGVLGLGLNGLSQTSQFNFLETAAGEGSWAPMPGAERTFAVFLAISDKEQSEITFGGWQVSRLHDGDDLAWNQVQDPSLGYWQLQVFSITANGVKTDFCDNGGCRAVVDTGTSLLGVPSLLGRDLAKALRHDANAEGLCEGPGPKLEMDLGNFTIVLDPEDYARPEMASEELRAAAANTTEGNSNATNRACIPMLMHIDLPQPLGPKTMILGEPVLQRYYTAFDAGAQRIGFATAKRDGVRRPPRTFG